MIAENTTVLTIGATYFVWS